MTPVLTCQTVRRFKGLSNDQILRPVMDPYGFMARWTGRVRIWQNPSLLLHICFESVAEACWPWYVVAVILDRASGR